MTSLSCSITFNRRRALKAIEIKDKMSAPIDPEDNGHENEFPGSLRDSQCHILRSCQQVILLSEENFKQKLVP